MDDGDEATFERRLRDYDERVAPLIDEWEAAGLPLIRLDGTHDEDALAHELVVGLDGLEAGAER
jgi:hypothetical protein